jgi:hypothetical protein
MRQAQHDEAREPSPGLGGTLEDARDLELKSDFAAWGQAHDAGARH